MDKELISIIVPVYNVESYLDKCINSILQQTYKNFELILINDGSTDNSGEICKKYLQKDDRVILINQANKGLSSARNRGIDIAKGKYITFVDSDDYIEIDYLEYLYQLLKKYDVKISMCACSVVMEKNKEINCGKGYSEQVMTKKICLERMLLEEGFSVSAWGKLYWIELFKNVRYPER